MADRPAPVGTFAGMATAIPEERPVPVELTRRLPTDPAARRRVVLTLLRALVGDRT